MGQRTQRFCDFVYTSTTYKCRQAQLLTSSVSVVEVTAPWTERLGNTGRSLLFFLFIIISQTLTIFRQPKPERLAVYLYIYTYTYA